MDLHILRNAADYQRALDLYEGYFDAEPEPGSAQADHFELLGLLLARYEDEHMPVAQPDPVDTLKFAMERLGLQQADLAELLGSRSRASEILNRRRELSLPQIRILCQVWRIPAESLIQPYALNRAAG